MRIEYKGEIVLIDECDYEFFKSKNWSLNRYVGQNSKIYLTCWNDQPFHRAVMGLTKGDKRVIDHANGNGLDNRRENLRVCSINDNNRNLPPNPLRTRNGKPKTSKYKGVLRGKNNNGSPKSKFTAYITVNKVCREIGYFFDEDDAARAYNDAALKHFGDFANLNIIPPPSEHQYSLPMSAS